jgi:coproporphyrinogen III oxidase
MLTCKTHMHTYTLFTLQAWADEYFYIPMRGEHRGVGGVFFDDLESIGGTSPGQFVRDIALAFMPSYLPIATARGTEVRHYNGCRQSTVTLLALLDTTLQRHL